MFNPNMLCIWAKNIIIQSTHTNIPIRLLFTLNLQSQSKAIIYSNKGCCTYRLIGYVNFNTKILLRSWQFVVYGYHEIQDFQKENDHLTNFYNIQIGPHGFIITNKQKWSLENLEGNKRKSKQYRDHCWTTIDINTYIIRFAKDQ
jgi:hypothetical protein